MSDGLGENTITRNVTDEQLTTNFGTKSIYTFSRERSGSVVESLTRDLRAVGLSLTGVTALCP